MDTEATEIPVLTLSLFMQHIQVRAVHSNIKVPVLVLEVNELN